MIKEKLDSVLLIILSAIVAMFSMGLVSCAQSAPSSFVCSETDLTIELSEDKSYYIVADCPEDKTEVVIIESYYGKPVKEIGENAFDQCEKLTKLSIPDCMININAKVFSDCKNLEYTEKGDAKYLGNENNLYVYLAKYLSKDVATIVVESNCKAIGNFAFYDCDNLKSVSFPDGLESIGNSAFYSCANLKSVILPDGLESIGNSAFGYCGFARINLPASLKNIGIGAFRCCQSLQSVVIPNGVMQISARTFEGCSRLVNVSFLGKLERICEFAFRGSGLKRITIPDGVRGIGMYAFEGCRDMTSVSIPSSVTVISSNAFSYCRALTTISFKGTKAQWEKVTKGGMWNYYVSAKAVSCTDGTASLTNK